MCNAATISLSGRQEKNEPQEGEAEQPKSADEGQSVEGLEPAKEALEANTEEPVSNEKAKPETESAEEVGPNKAKVEESSEEIPNDGHVSTAEVQPISETQIVSRKMEVPNDKIPPFASQPMGFQLANPSIDTVH